MSGAGRRFSTRPHGATATPTGRVGLRAVKGKALTLQIAARGRRVSAPCAVLGGGKPNLDTRTGKTATPYDVR